MKFVIFMFALVIVIAAIIGIWSVARQINYDLSYSDLVTETISQTVKQECIK